MNEEEFRKAVRDMVAYLLISEPTDDEETIDSYTDTMIFAYDEYYKSTKDE